MSRLRELFDEAWYRKAYFAEGRLPSGYDDAFEHYAAVGGPAGLSPGPHFDETWYRSAHPEAAGARSGYQHYIDEGAAAGLAPNRYFLARWYLAWYPDAAAAVGEGKYANAFEHYLREGLARQLSPNPFFEERWYRHTYADVDASVRAGALASGHQHFIECGAMEGRQGSPIFDPAWYVNRYPEVRKDIESGLARHGYDHFCRYGLAAGKSACAGFDESGYRSQYPEVAEAVEQGRWVSGLQHFVAEGLLDGYAPAAENGALTEGAAPLCQGLELAEFYRGADGLDVHASDEPVVSIVLALHNRAAMTLRCLRSIAAWVDVAHEVIAIDNGSWDETERMLARVRGVRVERNQRNLRFLRAANQGAAAARGKYLLFLNNDCELQAGAVRHAAEILDSQADAGAVGGRLLLPDGRLQEAGCYLRPNAFPAQFGRGQDPLASEFQHRREVPYCSGSFLLTPRALFEEAGGFDEAFCPMYGEDVDYCLRLWRMGRRVIFQPESVVAHQDSAAAYQQFIYPQALRNMAILERRHREYFEALPDYGIAPVASLDGKQKRRATLVIVERAEENPELAGLVERLIGEKRFVTIYPLHAWRGGRDAVAGWLPAEVELVSGRGLDELPAFCRERAAVYEEAIAWGCAGVRLEEWLPGVETGQAKSGLSGS